MLIYNIIGHVFIDGQDGKNTAVKTYTTFLMYWWLTSDRWGINFGVSMHDVEFSVNIISSLPQTGSGIAPTSMVHPGT